MALHYRGGGKHLQRLSNVGEYESGASTAGKVSNTTVSFQLTVTPSWLESCCRRRAALGSTGRGLPQQRGLESRGMHLCAAEPGMLCALDLGEARRGHLAQRQDTAQKIISSLTFCVYKLIPSSLPVWLTSSSALQGVI